MVDMRWKDKTCLKCIFNIDDACRRFPPTNFAFDDGRKVSYPMLQVWTRACAEYMEKD